MARITDTEKALLKAAGVDVDARRRGPEAGSTSENVKRSDDTLESLFVAKNAEEGTSLPFVMLIDCATIGENENFTNLYGRITGWAERRGHDVVLTTKDTRKSGKSNYGVSFAVIVRS